MVPSPAPPTTLDGFYKIAAEAAGALKRHNDKAVETANNFYKIAAETAGAMERHNTAMHNGFQQTQECVVEDGQKTRTLMYGLIGGEKQPWWAYVLSLLAGGVGALLFNIIFPAPSVTSQIIGATGDVVGTSLTTAPGWPVVIASIGGLVTAGTFVIVKKARRWWQMKQAAKAA